MRAPDAPKASLVVPLYQETARFEEGFDELRAFAEGRPGGCELVFVDDGSTDGTAELVEKTLQANVEVEARLLRLPHRGKGHALRCGIALASGDVVAFTDIDIATDLDDLGRIIDEAAHLDAMVVGSRAAPGARLEVREPIARELLGRLFNVAVRALVLPAILDTQCGAKAAPAAVWRRILGSSTEDGFAWDCEVLLLARQAGVAVVERPVRWRHGEASRVDVAADGLAMVRSLLQLRRRLGRARSVGLGTGPFIADQADQLTDNDSSHWWFREKADFVRWVLDDDRVSARTVVDVGAGAGGVTARCAADGRRLIAVDGSPQLAAHARTVHGLPALAGLADRLPLRNGSIDAVLLLDVIEHVPDPVALLREARRVVRDDGVVVVTVPAHRWLWSAADEWLGHRTRYSRRDVERELAMASLEPAFVSHVFSWLVAPAWLVRRASVSVDAATGLNQNHRLAQVGARVLGRAERAVLRYARLPFGTSILATARPVPPPTPASSRRASVTAPLASP